ncbi:MAG: haloacid dehalogenase-like hydrolase [Planctomycetes bacterium]|nr:haloacid dehalogenase-like hydrolase [Planctomycetota bacterium]
MKLLILDVDGVVFRSHFLIEMSRRLGPRALARAWMWATAFNRDRIGIRELVERTFRRFRGLSVGDLSAVYERMAIAPGSRELIEEAHRRGCKVVLLSSGVPDRFVRDLAARLGADGGMGIGLVLDGEGRLTGEVEGPLLDPDGKIAYVAGEIRSLGIDWPDVVAVGDDPGNLALMERAGRGIGVNARGAVRKMADWIVDDPDLRAIVPVLEGAPCRGAVLPPNEIRRRLIHATAVLWPLLARISRDGAVAILGVVAILYAISEWLRLNGAHLPAFTAVTRRTVRPGEARRFAAAPLTLSAGVALSLYLPDPLPYVAVGVVALADTMASLVGQRFGRIRLPHNRSKSVEGSIAALATAFAWSLVFLSPAGAARVALASAITESLPVGDWDNLLMPIAAGLVGLAVV